MLCNKCQAELDEASQTCPHCGEAQNKVEILTPEERENFQGLTLESPGREDHSQTYHDQTYYDPQKGVYVRHFSYGAGKGSLWNRLLIGLIVLIVVFLAFPFLFMILGLVLIGGFLSLVWRRR